MHVKMAFFVNIGEINSKLQTQVEWSLGALRAVLDEAVSNLSGLLFILLISQGKIKGLWRGPCKSKKHFVSKMQLFKWSCF